MVYIDAEKLYSEVREDCHTILDNALGVLLSNSVPLSESLSDSQPFNIIAINPTPFARREIIKIPLTGGNRNLFPTSLQSTVDGKHGFALLEFQENEMLAKPTVISTDHGSVSGK